MSLKTFLTKLRKDRVVGAAQAITRIGGQGWRSEGEDLTKTFEFSDFKEASFFIDRYSHYCTKVGATPSWSNTYNKVDVTLTNEEFKEISTKEIELARYLDTLERVQVTTYEHIEDTMSFKHIMEKGNIGVESKQNTNEKTPLYLDQTEQTLKLA